MTETPTGWHEDSPDRWRCSAWLDLLTHAGLPFLRVTEGMQFCCPGPSHPAVPTCDSLRSDRSSLVPPQRESQRTKLLRLEILNMSDWHLNVCVFSIYQVHRQCSSGCLSWWSQDAWNHCSTNAWLLRDTHRHCTVPHQHHTSQTHIWLHFNPHVTTCLAEAAAKHLTFPLFFHLASLKLAGLPITSLQQDNRSVIIYEIIKGSDMHQPLSAFPNCSIKQSLSLSHVIGNTTWLFAYTLMEAICVHSVKGHTHSGTI